MADINPGEGSGQPVDLADSNKTLFFQAFDLEHGLELWKSDGTAAGTQLVRDVRPGRYDSTPRNLIDVDGVLYFTAYDAEHGGELWKTDGTDEGTQLVRDIAPGPYSFWYDTPQFTNVNGTLFFIADDRAHGFELWKCDGTEAGTQLVRDTVPGMGGSVPGRLTNVSGTLFFWGWDEHGRELWKSDGTAGGTQLVRDIWPGGSSDESKLNHLTNVDGMLFFTANDPEHGNELWKSNGTEAGTVLVRDITLGDGDTFDWDYNDRTRFTDVDGTLFFVADDHQHGNELWTSDGTEAGTRLVRDIFPGPESGVGSELVNVDGTLYFQALGGLWKSDGTEAGTQLVKDFRPGPDGPYLRGFNNVNGTLFFGASNADGDYGLWRSDGTEAGTQRLTDTLPRLVDLHPDFFANVNGTPYFVADDGVHGNELWKLAPMPGDTNYDSVVDMVDLNNVRNNFGYVGDEHPGDDRPGDTTGDGVVGLDDPNAVRNHFGEGTLATWGAPSLISTTLGAHTAAGHVQLSTEARRVAADRVLETTIWLRYQEIVAPAPAFPIKPMLARSR